MIGQNIKKYRKQKRMSQAELGIALNLSQGAISQWENGGSKPDINMIKVMAEMFGVSVLDLTGDVDIPAPEQKEAPADDPLTEQIMAKARLMNEEELRQLLRIMDAVKREK